MFSGGRERMHWQRMGYVIRTEMRKLFRENIFFGSICSLISHVQIHINEINISAT